MVVPVRCACLFKRQCCLDPSTVVKRVYVDFSRQTNVTRWKWLWSLKGCLLVEGLDVVAMVGGGAQHHDCIVVASCSALTDKLCWILRSLPIASKLVALDPLVTSTYSRSWSIIVVLKDPVLLAPLYRYVCISAAAAPYCLSFSPVLFLTAALLPPTPRRPRPGHLHSLRSASVFVTLFILCCSIQSDGVNGSGRLGRELAHWCSTGAARWFITPGLQRWLRDFRG